MASVLEGLCTQFDLEKDSNFIIPAHRKPFVFNTN